MDGNDKKAEWLLNLTEDKTIRDKPQFFPYLIIIDDVYDMSFFHHFSKKSCMYYEHIY